MSAVEKILLDTDIGTDIDDAVCLAYLLQQPHCDLLGITTVTGESTKRAELASVLCRLAGKDVPIVPGAEQPLIVPPKQKLAEQYEAVGDWDRQRSFPKGEAVEFLRKTIRQHPGEITLVTIAPLTNIGQLFSIDPEIPRVLKSIVLMCGRFMEPVPKGYGDLEWNALGDPHATHIVYRAEVSKHRSVGIDVTHKVHWDAGEFRSKLKGLPLMEPVLQWAEIWFRHIPGSTFHDPLAATTIFENDICTFTRGSVGIEIEDSERRGLTKWHPVSGGRHEIATAVDPDRFFAHLLGVLRGKVQA